MSLRRPGGASAPPAHGTSPSAGGSQPRDCGLHGKYRAFFRPEHHAAVLEWFHNAATEKNRRNFKRFVKAILAFDVDAAVKRLQTMEDRDFTGCAASVDQHASAAVQPQYHDACVSYLSFASLADRQAFRETFGTILPIPKTWSHTQMKTDFDPGLKFMKGEKMHRDGSKPLVGRGHIRPKSFTVDAPCEIIGHGRSAYGTSFAWKVAPALSTNVVQRAHDASFTGAPWGLYGEGSNKTQWVPQTLEDFTETQFSKEAGGGGGGRKFGNYNENMTHQMYRAAKLKKLGRMPTPPDQMVDTTQALPTPPKVPKMAVVGGLIVADDKSDATPPGRGGHQARHVMMVPKGGTRKQPVERDLIDVKQQSTVVSPIFCR